MTYKCQATHKRRHDHERHLWLVTCAGNPNMQREILTPIQPRYCPACGGVATAMLQGVKPPSREGAGDG